MVVDHHVAFVTGANRGIGLATAEELGALGITVVLGARVYGKGLVAAQNLRDVDIDAHAIECDVTNPEHHRTVFIDGAATECRPYDSLTQLTSRLPL
ncbi:MAG TPA: SDR family NAD(P)-dependent oxidoreductase [Pyrinomonadaceae bacterium]|nr:SDR family NAD(P)-dependent oxidoreductase [Pyrinomonadaceae bacterium]